LLVDQPSRLVLPEDGLLFFPVDNTKGLDDPGVQAYKQQMQDLAEESPSVKMPVPLGLLRFQDTITALTCPAAEGEPVVCSELRKQYSCKDDGGLCYLRLDDARRVYQACLQGLEENVLEKHFRAYLDFLHMQGVVTHDNAPTLENLVVINPMWLLKSFTRIIRDKALHKLKEDIHLPGEGEKALFEEG
jgi:hypothetical protein